MNKKNAYEIIEQTIIDSNKIIEDKDKNKPLLFKGDMEQGKVLLQ